MRSPIRLPVPFPVLAGRAALVTLLAAGCGGGDDAGGGDVDGGDDGADVDAGSPGGADGAQPDGLLGDWIVTGGHLLPPAGPTIRSAALRLDPDGTGMAVFSAENAGFATCTPVFQLRQGDLLALDYTPAGFPVGQTFTIGERDGDLMTLVDDEGRFVFLSRPTEELEMPSCQMIEELSLHQELPTPTTVDSELEFDGTTLYYQSENALGAFELRAVSAASGELATPPDPFYPPSLHAWQDGSFWASCGCGGNEDVALTSAAGEADAISSITLGHPMNVTSMAADLDAGIVWIAGQVAEGNLLLRVDAGVEPDELLEAIPLAEGVELSSLAHDGSHLWTVVSALTPALARVDPATGALVDTWQIPARGGIRWMHVAIHAGRMFVLGLGQTDGAIMEVRRPGGA